MGAAFQCHEETIKFPPEVQEASIKINASLKMCL